MTLLSFTELGRPSISDVEKCARQMMVDEEIGRLSGDRHLGRLSVELMTRRGLGSEYWQQHPAEFPGAVGPEVDHD